MAETLIDRDAWEMLRSMTDSQFLSELVETYLTDSPALIEEMRAGLAAGSVEAVRRAAHSLKSNSASFGATRLAAAARDLEMLAKGGTLLDGNEKLAVIEAEYALLVPELREMKNES